MTSKSEEVFNFIKRRAAVAIAVEVSTMGNRGHAEVLREDRAWLCDVVASAVVEEYSMLELSDIMEWKRTRSRR